MLQDDEKQNLQSSQKDETPPKSTTREIPDVDSSDKISKSEDWSYENKIIVDRKQDKQSLGE